MQRILGRFGPLIYLASNWITLLGFVLLTTSGVLWLFLLPTMLSGDANPYTGILSFLALPAVFFLGLFLVPLGIWRARRQGTLPVELPPLDWSNARFRKLVLFLVLSTAVNVVIGSQLSYSAVSYMDSSHFCGQTCHTVMKPEFTAYQNSPHSRVECTKCHIGPGADFFVKAKISGSWQLVSVSLNLYPRPIPTPVHNLRPARETCEVCHWPDKYGADRLRVVEKFSDDEKTENTKSVLLMRIGGGSGRRGIHGAHMAPGVEMRYAAEDEKRQKIAWVEYKRGNETHTYPAADLKGGDPGSLPLRVMDCMDCHNRPSHTYELPERAINNALNEGMVNRDLPFVRKAGLEIIKATYATTEAAEHDLPEKVREYYRKNYPEVFAQKRAEVEQTAKGLLTIYSRNVFPEMKVTWGSYPNNLGHEDFPGCFRCHDGREAKQGEGRVLTQDCNTCHSLLAMEEKDPKILTDLGAQ